MRRIGVIISHFLQLESGEERLYRHSIIITHRQNIIIGSIQTTLHDPFFCPIIPYFNFVKCGLENSERGKFGVKLKGV